MQKSKNDKTLRKNILYDDSLLKQQIKIRIQPIQMIRMEKILQLSVINRSPNLFEFEKGFNSPNCLLSFIIWRQYHGFFKSKIFSISINLHSGIMVDLKYEPTTFR